MADNCASLGTGVGTSSSPLGEEVIQGLPPSSPGGGQEKPDVNEHMGQSGEGGQHTPEELLLERLRRGKEQAQAEAQRARAELEAAWAEMRDAWEVREEEEQRLRQLLARLESRNADLELRDRELRGDLSRLAAAETALSHARLVQKFVYNAFHKGFLNDEELEEEEEEDEDDEDNKLKKKPSGGTADVPPEVAARQLELNEIEVFVQRKRLERASMAEAASAANSATSAGNATGTPTSLVADSGEVDDGVAKHAPSSAACAVQLSGSGASSGSSASTTPPASKESESSRVIPTPALTVEMKSPDAVPPPGNHRAQQGTAQSQQKTEVKQNIRLLNLTR